MSPDTELYDDGWSAELYDFVSAPWKSDVAFWLSLAEQAGDPVLELACGTGRIVLPIAQAGYQVTGLDRSPHMLAIARRKLAQEALEMRDRLRLVEGDMSGFALDQQFGLIIIAARSFQALLTRAQQRSCLEACARHLKPGGCLALDVFNPSLSRLARAGGVDETPDEYAGPGEEAIRETGHTDYDLANQSLRWRSRQEWHDVAGTKQVREYVCDLHYFFRFEMEWTLEACSFEVEALYGNFDRSPFTADSPEMIFVARGAR